MGLVKSSADIHKVIEAAHDACSTAQQVYSENAQLFANLGILYFQNKILALFKLDTCLFLPHFYYK